MIFPFLESFIYFVNCIVKTVENIRRIFLILVSHFSKSNVIAALDSGRCFVKWYEILLIGPGRNKNWKKNDVCLEFEFSQNVLFLYQHKLILYQCLLYWWTISLCRFHFLSFLLTRNYPFPPLLSCVSGSHIRSTAVWDWDWKATQFESSQRRLRRAH